MLKKIFYFAIILSAFFRVTSLAQTTLLIPDEQASAKDTIPTDTTTPAPQVVPSSSETNTDTIPVINYTATPKEYIIADIKVTGIENTMYEDQSFVLIGFSGLSKGSNPSAGRRDNARRGKILETRAFFGCQNSRQQNKRR